VEEKNEFIKRQKRDRIFFPRRNDDRERQCSPRFCYVHRGDGGNKRRAKSKKKEVLRDQRMPNSTRRLATLLIRLVVVQYRMRSLERMMLGRRRLGGVSNAPQTTRERFDSNPELARDSYPKIKKRGTGTRVAKRQVYKADRNEDPISGGS